MDFHIDGEELQEIIIALAVIALAFSVGDLMQGDVVSAAKFVFPIVLVGVGSGFIVHEMAHKFVAMRFGAYARFQMWMNGLLAALVLAVVTRGAFVFAAPGAVYIYAPYLTRYQNGVISLAGPLTNLALGVGFEAFAVLMPEGYLRTLAGSAAHINLFLGFFNMIPVPPLDGSKVLGWNPVAWAALAVPLFLLAFGFVRLF